MQQNASPGRREAPGGHDRLAPLARADTFGDAIDEEIDDLVPAQVSLGEVLVVPPELLAKLGDCGPRQQELTIIGPEGVLDVPHRQAAGQHLDGQLLQRLGPPLGVPADVRPEGIGAPGDLRGAELDRALGRFQATGPVSVAVALALFGAALIVIPPQSVPRLGLQRLLEDQPRRELHQLRPAIGRGQPTFDQRRKGLAGAHRCRYSLLHGVLPGWRRRQPAKVVPSPSSRAAPFPNFQQV